MSLHIAGSCMAGGLSVICLEVTLGLHGVQIWWPWASAVWGEVQFELMMAILWENLAEPCSFGPKRPPPFPIGTADLPTHCIRAVIQVKPRHTCQGYVRTGLDKAVTRQTWV